MLPASLSSLKSISAAESRAFRVNPESSSMFTGNPLLLFPVQRLS